MGLLQKASRLKMGAYHGRHIHGLLEKATLIKKGIDNGKGLGLLARAQIFKDSASKITTLGLLKRATYIREQFKEVFGKQADLNEIYEGTHETFHEGISQKESSHETLQDPSYLNEIYEDTHEELPENIFQKEGPKEGSIDVLQNSSSELNEIYEDTHETVHENISQKESPNETLQDPSYLNEIYEDTHEELPENIFQKEGPKEGSSDVLQNSSSELNEIYEDTHETFHENISQKESSHEILQDPSYLNEIYEDTHEELPENIFQKEGPKEGSSDVLQNSSSELNEIYEDTHETFHESISQKESPNETLQDPSYLNEIYEDTHEELPENIFQKEGPKEGSSDVLQNSSSELNEIYEDTHETFHESISQKESLETRNEPSFRKSSFFYETIFECVKKLQACKEIEDFWGIFSKALIKQLDIENLIIYTEKEGEKENLLLPAFHYGSNTFPAGEFKVHKGLLRFIEKENYVKKSSYYIFKELPQNFINSSEKKIIIEQKTEVITFFIEPYPQAGARGQVQVLILLGKKINHTPYIDEDLKFIEELIELSLSEYIRIKELSQNYHLNHSLLDVTNYKTIFNLAHHASNCQNIEELYTLLKENLEEQIGATSYSLALLSLENQVYQIEGAKGLGFESRKKFRLGIDANLVSALHSPGRIYHLSDYKFNSEVRHNYSERDLNIIQNYWIIPIIIENCLLGIVNIYDLKVNHWDKVKHELAIAIVEIMSPYVLHLMLKEKPELLNFMRDPLIPLKKYLTTFLEENQKIKETKIKQALADVEVFISIVDIRMPRLHKNIEGVKKNEVHRFLTLLNQCLSSNLSNEDYLKSLSNNHYVIVLKNKNYETAEQWLKKLQGEIPKYIARNEKQSSKKIKYKYNIYSSLLSDFDFDELIKILN